MYHTLSVKTGRLDLGIRIFNQPNQDLKNLQARKQIKDQASKCEASGKSATRRHTLYRNKRLAGLLSEVACEAKLQEERRSMSGSLGCSSR